MKSQASNKKPKIKTLRQATRITRVPNGRSRLKEVQKMERPRNSSLQPVSNLRLNAFQPTSQTDSLHQSPQVFPPGDVGDITSQEYDIGLHVSSGPNDELDFQGLPISQIEGPEPEEVLRCWLEQLPRDSKFKVEREFLVQLSQVFPSFFGFPNQIRRYQGPALTIYGQEFFALIEESLMAGGDHVIVRECLARRAHLFHMYGSNLENLRRVTQSFLHAIVATVAADKAHPDLRAGWEKLEQTLLSVMQELNTEAEELPPEFTPRNVGLVQGMWDKLKANEQAGLQQYLEFFQINPMAKRDFGISLTQDLEKSKKLRKISSKMMKGLSFIIANLHNWPSQQMLIQKLSEFHGDKAVTYEKFAQFGQASVSMLRQMLADRVTEEVVEAWQKIYQGLMSALLRRQLELTEHLVQKSPFNAMNQSIKTEEEKQSAHFYIPSSHLSGAIDQHMMQQSSPSGLNRQNTKKTSTGELIMGQSQIETFIRKESLRSKAEMQDEDDDGGSSVPARVDGNNESILRMNEEIASDAPRSQEPQSEVTELENGPLEMVSPVSPEYDEDPQNVGLLHRQISDGGSGQEGNESEIPASEQQVEDIGFELSKVEDYGSKSQTQDKQSSSLPYEEYEEEQRAQELVEPEAPAPLGEEQSQEKSDERIQADDEALIQPKPQQPEPLASKVTYRQQRVGSLPQVVIQKEEVTQLAQSHTKKSVKVEELTKLLKGSTVVGREKLSIESIQKSVYKSGSIVGESQRSTKEPSKSIYEKKTSLALTAATNKKSLVDQARDSVNHARRQLLLQPLDHLKQQREREKQFSQRNKDNFQKVFSKLEKDVDFHHKIAYRFEKAYRLRKKVPVSEQRKFTLEIIDCMSEFSQYVEEFESSIFYCLHFCIIYNIHDLINFFRDIIQIVEYTDERTDQLLESIDIYGIARLREIGDPANQVVYHTVLYRAMEEKLRIVYFQILRQLRFIQLRDQDALKMILDRDYELIDLMITKHTTKLNIASAGTSGLKSNTYRVYNRAYFEEIIINYEVEPRVADDFRRRYLKTAEDLLNVFEMYCKEDYEQHFLRSPKDQISRADFLNLIDIALHNDSLKIASLIFLNHLSPSDISEKRMDLIISTIEESTKLHETKLFFVHEFFDQLSIAQLDRVMNIYFDSLSSPQAITNPLICQYNPIKVTLLIYRVCWRIEEKKIYSLVTKCQSLQSYLIKSLLAYFNNQTNILWLRKLMSEPILSTGSQKDCLDLMYEMNLKELLQHTIVVDVVNLTYQGEYSIEKSMLAMSKTFECAVDIPMKKLQSITGLLLKHVKSFGANSASSQSSLSFHIWKGCIQQRQQDEMNFTVLFSVVLILLVLYQNSIHNQAQANQRKVFGQSFYSDFNVLYSATEAQGTEYCLLERDLVEVEHHFLANVQTLTIILALGHATAIIQKLTAFRLGENAKFEFIQLSLDTSIVLTGLAILFCITDWNPEDEDRVAVYCDKLIPLDEEQYDDISHITTLRRPLEHRFIGYKMAVCSQIFVVCMSILSMVSRTSRLGPILTLVAAMVRQIALFCLTFGVPFLIYLAVANLLSSELRQSEHSAWLQFLELFYALNSKSSIHEYKGVVGFTYITSFIYVFQVLLISLLIAMFINTHRSISQSLEAHAQLEAIRVKNAQRYNRALSGVTGTFFPINMLMLPFYLPVVFFQNPRVSETVLKLQYSFMVVLYCSLAVFFLVLSWPFLYLKLIANSVLIARSNQREDFKGQKIRQVLISIFLGPFLILASACVDVCILPGLLMKPEQELKPKYDMYSDKMTLEEMRQMGKVLDNLEKKYNRRFKDIYVTCHKLMNFHTQSFQITDKVHNFMCRGTMDFRLALSIIREYNSTKILSRQFAIPSPSNKMKDGICNFELIFNILDDIEVYNFMDILLRYRKQGELWRKAETGSLAVDPKAYDMEEYHAREIKDETNGLKPTQMGPDGQFLHRNASDYVNNIRIDIACSSFLHQGSAQRGEDNGINKERVSRLQEAIHEQQAEWRDKAIGNLSQYFDGFRVMSAHTLLNKLEIKTYGVAKTMTPSMLF